MSKDLTEKVWPTKAGFEQNSTASWQDQRQYGWMHEDEFSLTAARLLIGFWGIYDLQRLEVGHEFMYGIWPHSYSDRKGTYDLEFTNNKIIVLFSMNVSKLHVL